MKFSNLTDQIINTAFKIHSDLGCGLFEEVYKACLKHELSKKGLNVLSEVSLPVVYNGTELDIGYRIDLLVEDTVILELKSVEAIADIHRAQLLTYLKLSKKEVGLLLNFNTLDMKNGLTRIVN